MLGYKAIIGQLALILIAALIPASALSSTVSTTPARTGDSFVTTPEYCAKVLAKVDDIVRENFYDGPTASTVWPRARQQYRSQILASHNLYQLGTGVNLAIRALHSSHCQFITQNDEIYYFLHTLFTPPKGKIRPQMDFTGAIVGGVNCDQHQVRYVLDGSPAATAGVLPGDQIMKVAGQAYRGQVDFWRTSGRALRLDLVRDRKPLTLTIKPVRRNCYHEYVEATKRSVRLIKTTEGTIGYIHLWSGGNAAHDALEDMLANKLNGTDGLILDLRDGYGGNFFNDLDYFYRTSKAYPTFWTYDRQGKRESTPLTYEKPVVALINGGSRSGKELLAFSLKRTGRAKLIGERTAGAVLAGKLFEIDDRTSLYLAIQGGDVAGVTLEGQGVSPDIEIPGTWERSGQDKQLQAAQAFLQDLLKPKTQSGLALPRQKRPFMGMVPWSVPGHAGFGGYDNTPFFRSIDPAHAYLGRNRGKSEGASS